MNNIRLGSKVQVSHYCTTDHLNRQGHEGKVIGIVDDVVTVRFSDGVIGDYMEEVLISLAAKKEVRIISCKAKIEQLSNEKSEITNPNVLKGYCLEVELSNSRQSITDLRQWLIQNLKFD